jgi:hypothetical protein
MQTKIPREKKDFIYHFGNVMEQVKSASLFLIPEQPSNAVEALLQIMVIKKVDADELVQSHRNVGRMKRESFINIATAYCAQAGRENVANHHDIAWTYLLEAAYYAGGALYVKALEQAWPEMEQATAKAAVTETRSKGGTVRNAGWKRIEDEAVRLVKMHGERGQKWSTERKMAVYIQEELWPFASREVPTLSEARYVQTISTRLKSRQSDIAIYLDKKRGASC